MPEPFSIRDSIATYATFDDAVLDGDHRKPQEQGQDPAGQAFSLKPNQTSSDPEAAAYIGVAQAFTIVKYRPQMHPQPSSSVPPVLPQPPLLLPRSGHAHLVRIQSACVESTPSRHFRCNVFLFFLFTLIIAATVTVGLLLGTVQKAVALDISPAINDTSTAKDAMIIPVEQVEKES